MRILNVIRRWEPIPRNQMAQMTGLSPSTVTNIVRELLEEGLVEETEPAPTGQVGRDPIGVQLNPKARSSIGIQVSDTRLTAVLLDFRGKVLRRIERELRDQSQAPPSPPELVIRIASLVNEMQDPSIPLLGVGVAVAGMVQRSRGVVFAPNLHASRFPLAKHLESLLDVPVFVENEVNTMLLAEHTYGVAQGWQNVLGVNVGLGIGGGIIMDGKLQTGSSGAAGEIGHMIVERDGPLCTCGRRGCLETLAGGKALIDPEDGESVDPQRLQRATTYLAIGIANAVNILNPEMVVIGGTHCHRFSVAEPAFRDLVARYLLPINQDVIIEPVSLPDAEAVGAAALVLNDYFQPAGVSAPFA